MRYLSFFLLIFTFLTACQSLKKINCSQLNWRSEGEGAAISGLHRNEALKGLIGSCKKKEAFVDQQAYNSGYKDGLRLFCKTNVGFKVGQSGQLYNNTCPGSEELSFLKGYIKGRILYLKNQLNLSKEEYTKAKDRFWRKEQEYLLIKNEDPEEAKMQRDFLEAYQEESNQLKEKVGLLKKELNYLKTKKEKLKFD